MKRYQKILLVTSACLIVAGGVMGVAGLALGGSPSFTITEKGIQTPEDVAGGKFVEKKLPLKDVSSMEIQWEEGDIEFVEGDSLHAEYGYDEKYMQVKEEKKNGTWYLTSKYIQQFNVSGIHFFWDSNGWERQESYLKIYIPKGTRFSDLNLTGGSGKIKIDLEKLSADRVMIDKESGNLEMKGIDSGEAFIEMEYGDGMTIQDCAIEKLNLVTEGGCSLADVTGKEVSLESDNGNLVLEQVASEQITVSSGTGDIRMDTLTGKNLSVTNDYGDVTLNGVTMDKGIFAGIESGTVQMDRVDAGSFELTSEYGNVKGNQVKIGKGALEVLYGECEIDQLSVKDLKIESESGEIKLAMTDEEKNYSMLLKTEYGEVTVNGENRGSDIVMERDQAKNRLDLKSENGNITINTR